MAEERISAKQYAKFDKVFFLFGSLSKMVQPVRPDEWRKIAEDMWSWAIMKVSALVDEYTEGFLDPPPDVGSPAADSPHNQEPSRGNTLKKKHITVKAIKPVKSGTNANGSKWTLTRITDTDNVSYTTFAGSCYVVGSQYVIEYKEEKNGQYLNRTIQEPREWEPGEDDGDIPC